MAQGWEFGSTDPQDYEMKTDVMRDFARRNPPQKLGELNDKLKKKGNKNEHTRDGDGAGADNPGVNK